MPKVDIQEAILSDLGEQMRQSVDYQMAYHMMMWQRESEGWTKISLPTLVDQEHAVDISHWLAKHGFKDKENYFRDGRHFLFEQATNATLFAMRWSG